MLLCRIHQCRIKKELFNPLDDDNVPLHMLRGEHRLYFPSEVRC